MRKVLALIRIQSETSSRLHMVDRDQFFIGRSAESEVLIAQPGISRKHAMVEIKSTDIYVTDLSSSNGTFINETKIEPNKKQIVSPGTEIRLGRSTDSIKIELMERPVEFGNYEPLLPQFTKDLERAAEGMMKNMEAQLQQELEVVKKHKVMLLDQELDKLRKGENQAVQARIEEELEKHREQIRTEMTEFRNTIKAEATEEADEILLAAHNEILQLRVDYAEEYKKQQEDAQVKAAALIQHGEERAEKLLAQAREVNDKLREKTRKDQEEILVKARAQSAELMVTTERDAKSIVERAKKQAEQDVAHAMEFAANEIKQLKRDAQDAIEAKKNKHKDVFEQCEQLEKDIEKHRSEKANLMDAIQELSQELRAITQENERQHELNKQLEALQEEIKKQDVRKVQLQEENARNEASVGELQRKRIQELDSQCAAKERQMAMIISQKAKSLAQRVEETILNEISKQWPDSQLHISTISKKVSDELMTVFATDAFDKTLITEKTAGPKFFRSKAFRWGIAAGFAGIIAFLYQNSKHEIVSQAEYTSLIIEKQKEEARFIPEMDNDFRSTYADNVLYNKNYVSLKMDEKVQNQWALNLNEFFLKKLKLSEENMVRFIGMESSMIKRLVTLREAIDARNAEEGLQRMRDAENEDTENMIQILGSRKNYMKLRAHEKSFLTDVQIPPEARVPAKAAKAAGKPD